MNRRNVLAILGLGGVATISGAAYTISTDSDAKNADPPDSLELPKPKDKIQSIHRTKFTGPSRELTFDYQPVSETFDDTAAIGSVTARPVSDQSGDRLRLTPGTDITAETLAARLRTAWNVGENTEVTSEINGVDVTFLGGSVHSYGILVATNKSASTVLAARGESLSIAKELATSWAL